MSITFPLSVEAFADRLLIDSVNWMLKPNQQQATLASGDTLVQDLAPALWSGDITTVDMYHDEARQIEAKINALNGALGTFYLYDPRSKGPHADPTGSILGAATPTIGSLGDDNKSLTLAALPAAYVLTEGDYLAFDYGDPARRAFHELSEAVTADANGSTGFVEVRPFIRPGVVAGAAVTLVKAAMKCSLVPGSLSVTGTSNGTTVVKFSVVQKP